ncbi:MAG: citramalate synthase, partial [Hyphomicrobiales bacterium]
MTKERLYLFDTTLRDGQQTPGIDFSLEDKIQIAHLLDDLGVDFVEGGYPGANPTDTAFFAENRTSKAMFTAFGMTKRAGRSVENDPGVQALLSASGGAICYVAKAWDYHVRVALGCTNEENLEGIAASVKAAVDAGKLPLVDCEHFFDGYKANPDYALACARTAYDAGARWVVLCDTNGGTLPTEIKAIIAEVIKHVPGDHLGIHAHDDTEQAVANSLAAVDAGVRQIQGTLNGIGERCGNANLISIIPTLKLKPAFSDRFEVGVSDKTLRKLTTISKAFEELLNRSGNSQAAYVGSSAFATKAGIHASALLKEP